MPGGAIAGQRFPGDDGTADPAAAAALAAYASGQGSEHAALTALAAARLLVPVVPVPAEHVTAEHVPAQRVAGENVPAEHVPAQRVAGEKLPADAGPAARATPGPAGRPGAREMAMPLLVGNDGRYAVLAFTSLGALARWRADARPVPVAAAQVWQSGITDASAVVVDVAGPVPLTVEGARLAALAAGQPPPLPHEDPDLLTAAQDAVAAEPVIAAGTLAAASCGGDLALRVRLAAGCEPGSPAVAPAIQRAAGQFLAATGGRLRRGVEVTVEGSSP